MNREIKFRAWDGEDMLTNLDSVPLEALRVGAIETPDGESVIKCIYMQYTGLKDKDGVEIFEGDLINVYFTSSDHEHIHDGIYSVCELGSEGLRLKFEKLLWESFGYNQYPSDTELSIRYGSVDVLRNEDATLIIRDQYGENKLYHQTWKTIDRSEYFKKLGNVHENPEILK